MTYAADSNDYRELFDDAPVAYHELDEQGIIRKVNNAKCQLLGFSAEEMIGRPIWEFLVGEEAAVSRIAISEKLAGKRPLAPFCRTYVTRDNRYRTVEVRDRLIRNAVGDGFGIRSALIDITERLAAEYLFTNSIDWRAAVLRSLADGIIAMDSLGRIVSMNPAAEFILNLSEPAVIGAAFEEHNRSPYRRTTRPDVVLRLYKWLTAAMDRDGRSHRTKSWHIPCSDWVVSHYYGDRSGRRYRFNALPSHLCSRSAGLTTPNPSDLAGSHAALRRRD